MSELTMATPLMPPLLKRGIRAATPLINWLPSG